MKKISALLLALVLCLSLAACGSSPAADDSSSPAGDEQSLADADFDQMMSFAQSLSAQSSAISDWTAGVQDGSITADESADQYLTIADDCAALASEIAGASWQSDVYSAEIQMLTDAADALASGTDITYNALVENDAAAMDESNDYFSAYQEQISAFMDAVDQYQ